VSLVHDGPLVIIDPHVFLSVSFFNLSKVFEFVCQMFARGVDGSPLIVSDGAVCLAKYC
jgi:hypothetical protein